MQELCNALDKMELKSNYEYHFFIIAAANWATFVVKNNVGSALDAGLEISKAMIKYADAIGLTV